MIEQYINHNDWRIKENSNTTYSLSGMMHYLATSEIAKYMLKEVYTKEIAEAHKNGDFHIHDLGYNAAYCMGWSLEKLIMEGLNGVKGKTESGPAKHLSALTNQMINFLGCTQMETAGAQAFNSVDTFLAPFVKVDGLNYREVKQCMQNLIYHLNYPSRWGCQAPFTNFTLDLVCPDDKLNSLAVVGGKFMDFTYGDCQNEMDMINLAILEVLEEGDWTGKIFPFPIITYNITKEFNWESKVAQRIFEVTAKYGFPYFSNFINSDMKPSDVRSMCCRLRLDLTKLERRHGGLFGAGDQTGSIGVVTINLPRIGYLANTKEEYFKRLDDLLLIAKESLDIKRKMVQDNMDKGLYPYVMRYLGTLRNHFSTIGIIGMHESLMNFMGKTLDTEEGHSFATEILDHINNKLSEFQVSTPGVLYNLEATPAEGASYRLAKEDLKRYPKIITSGTKTSPYYTNSVHLPVNYSDNIFEVLDIQDELQTKFTSGTVIHLFLGEQIKNPKVVASLVKKICENYRLPYFSITPTFSICPKHNYIEGEHFNCPTCGNECLVYSRIVGYYSPIQNWNRGKTQEWKERKMYKVNECKL